MRRCFPFLGIILIFSYSTGCGPSAEELVDALIKWPRSAVIGLIIMAVVLIVGPIELLRWQKDRKAARFLAKCTAVICLLIGLFLIFAVFWKWSMGFGGGALSGFGGAYFVMVVAPTLLTLGSLDLLGALWFLFGKRRAILALTSGLLTLGGMEIYTVLKKEDLYLLPDIALAYAGFHTVVVVLAVIARPPKVPDADRDKVMLREDAAEESREQTD